MIGCTALGALPSLGGGEAAEHVEHQAIGLFVLAVNKRVVGLVVVGKLRIVLYNWIGAYQQKALARSPC